MLFIKSGQTVADSAKIIFTERMMKLIVFQTLNAPAKAGGFYQLIENNQGQQSIVFIEFVLAMDNLG